MIFVPKKNVYFPQHKWGTPYYQKGIICAVATFPTAQAGDVTLSGETTSFNDTAFPWNAEVQLKIDADGNMYSSGNTNIGSPSFSQIDSTDDWIRPTGDASADYEVQASINSGTFSSGSTAWQTLGTDRIWIVNITGQFNIKTCNFDLDIRWMGGSSIANAVYILQASCDL